MKYTKLFGWFAAAALLLTTSCKDDLFEGSNGLSDKVTVSFTLAPEAATTVRGITDEDGDGNDGHVTYPGEGEYGHISDGSKADKLIYAVYDKDGNLLEEYSDNTEEELNNPNLDHGVGQTVKIIEKFPHTVTLTLRRGETYSIAFWAQSSKTNAYNTEDLKKVEVRYSEFKTGAGALEGGKTATPNNDELRDAFCRSVKITATENGMSQNVLLYRPLAQINVGVSGYDYEAITRKSDTQYKFSRIQLNHVARYLDVVKDSIYSSTISGKDDGSKYGEDKENEAFTVADFGYAPIPAYVNYYPDDYRINDNTDFPFSCDPSYTIWDWKYNGTFEYPGSEIVEGSDYKKYFEREEFLKVKLYDEVRGSEGKLLTDDNGMLSGELQDNYTNDIDKDEFLDYANISQDINSKKSETFKYLSMCYVLTPSTKDHKTLLNNVRVWVAKNAEGADEMEIVNLNNVPAQRDWRTNIVGNLFSVEKTFEVKLDKDFAGEYNGWAVDDDWQWSGPLAKGVYYDAKADEIQISDVDGLLWFQQMVNGKLIVRDAFYNNNEDTKNASTDRSGQDDRGKDYPYYTGKIGADGKEITARLDYKYVAKPTDPVLLERILRATHQDCNTSSDRDEDGWPKNGNFHFCGTNGPAHVKLMADIDLSGIKWIPIGWDVKVHDTSLGNVEDGVDNNNKLKYKSMYLDFVEADGTQRAFCGTFDGNNHTISNLENRTFTAKVHDEAKQFSSNGPYDNVQWLPSGFFGMVGGWRTKGVTYEGENTKVDTQISNLRLLNVNIFGYHVGAAVAAIVNSKDDNVNITNCLVDGGTVELSPMYRGDQYAKEHATPAGDRTFARGIYAGGIVGHFVANGNITGCEVRNMTIRGYRQIGGLVGSVSNKEQNSFKDDKIEVNISDNSVYNTLILADKFQPYDFISNDVDTGIKAWKNGFGWKAEQKSLANPFVGGTQDEEYKSNSSANVQFTEFSTGLVGNKRTAKVGVVPLKRIPMLSSWFCDEITLEGNYYGETSVYTARNYYDFEAWPHTKPAVNKKPVTVKVPFDLPYIMSIDYNYTEGKPAAMYVESVTLDGRGGNEGHSVITPEGLKDDGAVLYVTARDRSQFYDLITSNKDQSYVSVAQPTVIRNVVLRGAPYAHTGILLAPNTNMSKVQLENVSIYDVYQTLALNTGSSDIKSGDYKLVVDGSNFRGYTVPGNMWSSIEYTNTTFEQGTYTDHGVDEMTYKVDGKTIFTKCFFKAPYIIDLNGYGSDVTFGYDSSYSYENLPEALRKQCEKDGGKCYATAESGVKRVAIDVNKFADEHEHYGTLQKIQITKNAQGHPIVLHHYENETRGYDEAGNVYDKNLKKVTE